MFWGECKVFLSYLILALTTRWLLKNGCMGYLAHIIDTRETTMKLEDAPVVIEFPNVFWNDLPGLHPREKLSSRLNFFWVETQSSKHYTK